MSEVRSAGLGPGLGLALAALAAAVVLGAAGPALAQSQMPTMPLFTIDPALAEAAGGEGMFAQRVIQLFVLVTVLSLAPGIAMMATCFPFMVTVLSILRQAIGVQTAPPAMMMVSLALFLTWFVMEPVFAQAWRDGIGPWVDGNLDERQALPAAVAPFRTFIEARVDGETLMTLAAATGKDAAAQPVEAAPLSLLVPAFMLGEIARAFQIGFLIFLPFVVIDVLVSAILMSMGMMMVPPVVVALPLKLAFFVVADGWSLLAGALVRSYA